MAQATMLKSHHEKDAEDARLLAAGAHKDLVESYYGHIVRRCRARTRTEDAALDVAANVAVRLLEELARGRTYRVPYRVVVNKVIDWKLKEHYTPGPVLEVELFDQHTDTDPYSDFEADFDLDVALAELAERERAVAALRLRDGLEPEEIAERLDMNRNAVDQAWHRAKHKLRERGGLE